MIAANEDELAERRAAIAPGYTISRLLKGGWHLSSGHGAGYDRDGAIRDMAAFVEAGITSFDCADHYLGVEQLIGDFRRAHPGLAQRVQVHTKYVPDLESLATLKRADTVRIIDRSLARLGVETRRIRIGTGGVLLPYYSAFKVAEVFRMLEALYPGRIDLGIGRAPGGDARTGAGGSTVRCTLPCSRM